MKPRSLGIKIQEVKKRAHKGSTLDNQCFFYMRLSLRLFLVLFSKYGQYDQINSKLKIILRSKETSSTYLQFVFFLRWFFFT